MDIKDCELQAEIEKRERLGSCEVCDKNPAKYTCPKCSLKTCCLSCSKIHKKELECDGIRDKTKYIPLKKMTSMDFMNDYYFLEEATRFTKEIKCNWDMKGSKRLSNTFIKLKKAAQQRNIRLFFLTSSLKKRRRNHSFYDHKTDSINWYTEISFPNADFKTFIKINENTKLTDSIRKIIEEEDNKQLEFYKAHGMSKLRLLLKAEGLKRNKNRYYDLSMNKTLKANLVGKIIIEYPSISVVMDHSVDGYELVTSDDESIKTEQKEFFKTLQEEVFNRKIGDNPMFIVKPCEVPIIADVLNDDNQPAGSKVKVESKDQLQPQSSIEALVDDNEDIRPENYFF